jgi:hypothetical protein
MIQRKNRASHKAMRFNVEIFHFLIMINKRKLRGAKAVCKWNAMQSLNAQNARNSSPNRFICILKASNDIR